MPTQRSKWAVWWTNLQDWRLESLFTGRRGLGPPRTIYVNQDLPSAYFDHKRRPKKEFVYCTNQVITSKYTIITFLPRNLLEQFRRIANIFFAFIAILQFFPEFATISPGLVILPLLIVLAITAVKDGYEDIKRHQSDRQVNHSRVRLLAGGDWINPNFTGGKSRTFVRGLVAKSRRRPRSKADADADDRRDIEEAGIPTHTKHDSDIELDEGDTTLDEKHRSSPFEHGERTNGPHWRKTLWEDVRVGDFVKIMNNEPIPADILICATSEEDNVAYVETKNLDGETNLKSRNASQALTDLRTAADCADRRNVFTVECDRPDSNMYKLHAAVSRNKEKSPVDLQMVLLRGTILRNTDWVIGVVLFTGVDTKIVLNSGGTPSKRSRVERQTNPQVFINLAILAAMATACGVADYKIESQLYPEGAPWLYGDDTSDNNPGINGFFTGMFALITFQNIVPISLYISIEGVKTCQALFIYFDYEMFYKKTGQPALARSYNLSDDLGQIEYIVSDKTGTLTQNSMVFRECSIGGVVYSGDPEDEAGNPQGGISHSASLASTAQAPDARSSGSETPDAPLAQPVGLSSGVLKHFSDQRLTQDLARAIDAEPGSDNAAHARSLNGFFSVLALCHTVLTAVHPDTGAIEYKAQSPDEAALVQAAADVGFVFRGHNEYQAWSERYEEAVAELDDREGKVEAVCDMIEGDLRLLGATAIEDRLQDGVPETIADLKRAGIKVWVATGDKLETAIAIGHSTNLIAEDSNIIVIRGEGRPVSEQLVQALQDYFPDSDVLQDESVQADVSQLTSHPMRRLSTGVTSIVGENNGRRPGGYVLVIDGTALGRAFEDELNKRLLLGLGTHCEGVICCRVSPLQKALIVRLVKDGLHAVTLAIGDGANDVSMIQAADVGVGIRGEEGMQAVNSSDYAIAQFRFLKRLLLVHGHWSYARNGTMILNFFYKNIHSKCPNYLSGFLHRTDTPSYSVFDYTYLLFWNSFWTIAPVLGIGLFDRIVDADILMAFPELYRYGRERTWFTMKSFCVYMLEGVIQSVVLYFIITYAYLTTTARSDGYDIDQVEYSTTVVFASVATACLFNGLDTNVWTAWVFFAVFVGIVLLWLFTVVYNSISPGWIITNVYGNNHFLFRSAYFWLCQPLTITITLLPRYLYRAWRLGFAPGDLEILRYIRKKHPNFDLSKARCLNRTEQQPRRSSSRCRPSRPVSLASAIGGPPTDRDIEHTCLDYTRPHDSRRGSRTDMSTGMRSTYRGFDFATEEGGVAMRRLQSNLSERWQSNRHLPLSGEVKMSLKKKTSARIFSSLRRKKPPTPRNDE
ncbi:hypothetical protein ID866_3606 [Astraeus odoratus]|nr:hypothetical protein ID866_3606 [Astraeus odoratus]